MAEPVDKKWDEEPGGAANLVARLLAGFAE